MSATLRRDRHTIEGEDEVRRIEACRAKAPRTAALLDAVQDRVDATYPKPPMELELASVFLGAKLDRGVDLSEEQAARVLEILKAAGA